MANKKTLKPLGNGKRTKTEERKIQSEGGKKSGEVRRRKRDMRNAAKMLLDMKVDSKQTTMRAVMSVFGIPEEEMSYQMAVLAAQLLKAGNGDTKAAMFLRDTAGASPAERTHGNDTKIAEERLKIERERFEFERARADALEVDEEIENDGFIDALGHTATDDWNDEENKKDDV